MPKYFFFGLAIVWTGLIVFVCLIKSSDVPSINIVGIDKVVHFVMHLSFTSLWGMAFFKSNFFDSVTKVLVFSFLLSFVFGLLIEFAQGFLTTTRSADVSDILANVLGAFLAIAMLNTYCNAKKDTE